MAEYYPSEIARLVLGYLKEVDCLKAWETFLKESIHLQEHRSLLQSGRWCSTNIGGKSLLEILAEHCHFKDAVKKNKKKKICSTSANLNASSVHSSTSNINRNASFSENFKQDNQNYDIMTKNIVGRDETNSASFTDMLSFYGNGKHCNDLNIQESAASDGLFLKLASDLTNKDKCVPAPLIATVTSKPKKGTSKPKAGISKPKAGTSKPKAGTSKSHVNVQNKKCEQTLMTKTFLHLSASSQAVIPNGESTVKQNTPMSTNTKVPEPQQEDNNKTNLVQELGSTDKFSRALVAETISKTDYSKQLNTQEKNKVQDSLLSEGISQFPASAQFPAINQNTSAVPAIEIPEPMQAESDQTNLTRETGSKDMLATCMSIIQPDAEDQLQNCSLEQNDDAPKNVNDIQSTTLNRNESSVIVATSVVENGTELDSASTLKPVSIGTPFEVSGPQASCSVNQSFPTTHTIVCYPSLSLTENTIPFIQSERYIPILPAVNKNFSLNSNLPTLPFLQFPYHPSPSIPVQLLNGLQSKTIVVQPCSAHSLNPTISTNNSLTNEAFPVQAASPENASQNCIIHASSVNIPDGYSPSKSIFFDNIKNFGTVTSVETVLPNENTDEKESRKFSIEPSTTSFPLAKKKVKRLPKKKVGRPSVKKQMSSFLLTAKNSGCSMENDISDDILVIPHPSPNDDESISASEILTSITENEITQSPFQKDFISSAEKRDIHDSTHDEPLLPIIVHVEEIKPMQSNIPTEDDSWPLSPSLNQKASCELSSHSPSKSVEKPSCKKKAKRKLESKKKVLVTADMVNSTIEKISAHEDVSSSVSNVVLSAMQNAFQTKRVKNKKQDSSTTFDFHQKAGLNASQIKKTALKSSAGKKTVVKRDLFFNSLSAIDSDSDNIPLKDILVSKSKGNFLDKLNVLKSNEDMEMSETKYENVASDNIESKSPKKEQVGNQKKDHHPKFTSPSKEKSFTNNKTNKKNSSEFQNPQLSKICETREHILQNESADSLTHTNKYKVSAENFCEEEDQTLSNKQSMTGTSNICEKLKKKTITNEPNNFVLLNEPNFNSKQSSRSGESVKPIIKKRVLPPRKTKIK